MSAYEGICPIWGTPANVIERPNGRDGELIDSPRAGGKYFITGTAEATTNSNRYTDNNRKLLTTWIINRKLLGDVTPEIHTGILEEVDRQQPLTVIQRADKLLSYINSLSKHIGMVVSIKYDISDTICQALFAYSESINTTELKYLMEYLTINNWISIYSEPKGSISFKITVPGYSKINNDANIIIPTKQCFVAMWFDESMQGVYDNAVIPAITECGYVPFRIDRKEHIEKIDDQIIAEIRRSRFLIADFTHGDQGPRGGVYYEAGFARGLKIPVIFLCRNDQINNIHFDTRQFNHIFWADEKDLKDKLANRIRAVI